MKINDLKKYPKYPRISERFRILFNKRGRIMKFKPKKPFLNYPNIRGILKRKPQPSFEGVDLNGPHPLESNEPLHDFLQNWRNADNQVDDFLGLPRRE